MDLPTRKVAEEQQGNPKTSAGALQRDVAGVQQITLPPSPPANLMQGEDVWKVAASLLVAQGAVMLTARQIGQTTHCTLGEHPGKWLNMGLRREHLRRD